MSLTVNPGKELTRACGSLTCDRLAVRTRMVEIGDDCLDVVRTDIAPFAQNGDILVLSEKIIALCQKRVVYKKDIHPGFWARTLCRFVRVTPAGPGAGTPYKMQLIIDICSLPRVLFAAFCAAIARLLGRKGVFYRLCGHQVSAIDGLVADNISFARYNDYAILAPADPDGVCAAIERETGLPCAIVDACDLHVSMMGRSPGVRLSDGVLCELLRDNPAGQGGQRTPAILLRPHAG